MYPYIFNIQQSMKPYLYIGNVSFEEHHLSELQ